LRRRKDKIDRRLIQNPAYGPVVFSLFFAKAHLFFGADVLFCIFLFLFCIKKRKTGQKPLVYFR